jgi:fucose 4-O-acetylase-like acetyltransferase
LLLPFVIYYLISYLIFYVIHAIKPEVIVGQNEFSIFDVFTQRQMFNGPLWFLLSLFEVECLFYYLYHLSKNVVFLGVSSLCIGCVGLALSAKNIFLPCWIDTSLVAIPFFYTGFILSRSPYIIAKIDSWKLVLLAVCLYMVFMCHPIIISMSTNSYSNVYLVYPCGLIIVMVFLLLCKAVNNLKFISWLGKNTLIILCTHHIVYRPFKYIMYKANIESSVLLLVVTVMCEIIVIYIVNRYLPILTGRYKFFNKSHVLK